MRKQNLGAASAVPVFDLKPLKTTDVFVMARLVGKLGVGTFLSSLDKETLEKIMQMKDAPELMKDINTAAASVKIINIILENSQQVMPELMELLGHASGMTEEEIMDLPAAGFVDLMDAFFSRADTWDFFTRVSRLINMGS